MLAVWLAYQPRRYYSSHSMDLTRPHTALVPSLHGDVLVALANTQSGVTGRQIERLVPEASHRGVQLVLERLVGQGLVLRERVGTAWVYELNRDHVAAEAVLNLAELRAKLLSRLRMALSAWDPPATHASLYGSGARRDGDIHSDIDIFLVRPEAVDAADPEWGSQVEALRSTVERSTGNPAQILEVSESEAADLAAKDHAIARAVREDAVDLAGVPARRLLRRAGAP
jgi:hypothetical protein